MNDNINQGGSAFPVTYEGFEPHEGMTLRDYFAAKAMQEILSWEDMTSYESTAEQAYLMADQMLKARTK